jgi:hypothetical protein
VKIITTLAQSRVHFDDWLLQIKDGAGHKLASCILP